MPLTPPAGTRGKFTTDTAFLSRCPQSFQFKKWMNRHFPIFNGRDLATCEALASPSSWLHRGYHGNSIKLSVCECSIECGRSIGVSHHTLGKGASLNPSTGKRKSPLYEESHKNNRKTWRSVSLSASLSLRHVINHLLHHDKHHSTGSRERIVMDTVCKH